MSGSSYEEEEREENSMMFEYVLRNQQLLLEDLLKLEVGEEARTRIEAQLELIEKTLNSYRASKPDKASATRIDPRRMPHGTHHSSESLRDVQQSREQ